jgi:hypothetical protein
MAQSLEIDLKTNSDVPQAMEKAKAATESFNKQVESISKNTKKATEGTKEATSGFSKQVEGIGNKFANSFKEIFLSFLGPMALVTGAIALISKLIADNQKRQEEANQAAIDGTNELMSAEDRYWARKTEHEKKGKQDEEEAKVAREQVTQDFMSKDPRGYKIYQDYIAGKIGADRTNPFERNRKFNAKYDPEVQAAVQALIAEDAAKNPTISTALKKDKTETNFKGPEGFGNVIGVGPNPVLEAMAKQNEIALAQLAELQKISGTSGVPTDFTKTPSK